MISSSRASGTLATPEVARLTRLDGLRGIAACVVAVYHLQILFRGGLEDFLGSVAGWCYGWGWSFVELFFVISGYIFAHVYLGGAALREGRQLRDFAAARVARLYPLHLTMLAIVALQDWGKPENTVGAFLSHLFMMQGLVPGAYRAFVGPSWSISVEMLCYGLFALAACAGGRALHRMSVALVVLFALKMVVVGLYGGSWSGDRLPGSVLGFFTGQLLWQYRAALARVPTIVLLAILAAGIAIDAGAYSPLLKLNLLAWPALLLLVLRSPAFEFRPLLWLGERSYGVYLIHYAVLNAFAAMLGKLQASMASVVAVHLAFGIVVFALADIALRLVERPGRRAVRKAWIGYRDRPRAVTTVPVEV